MMVTLRSVAQPHGGSETRGRFTAEVFADLGHPMAIVSMQEPVLGAAPPWAASLHAPARTPATGISREVVRLIRASAATSTVVVITDPVLLPAVLAARVRQPIIWDTIECQSLHYRRLPATVSNRAKYLAWLGLERWTARRCWMAIAIGEVEAATWRATHPVLAGKLAVVDHAVLASPRDPVEARRALRSRVGRPVDGPLLLFLGTLRAKQNVAGVQWILDSLVGTLPPEVTVVLCGPGSDEVAVPPGGGATVVGLGAVDDVDSIVAGADLCLAPQAAGAGVKTKVLHYIAHGKRVAGTPIAFEGLADAPGLHAAPLDDLPELITRLCGETEPAPVAEERARAQRAWLDEHHGRAHVAEQWEKVLACLPN